MKLHSNSRQFNHHYLICFLIKFAALSSCHLDLISYLILSFPNLIRTPGRSITKSNRYAEVAVPTLPRYVPARNWSYLQAQSTFYQREAFFISAKHFLSARYVFFSKREALFVRAKQFLWVRSRFCRREGNHRREIFLKRDSIYARLCQSTYKTCK